MYRTKTIGIPSLTAYEKGSLSTQHKLCIRLELKMVKRCTNIEFSYIFYKALPKLTIIAPTHKGYLDDLISSYASLF